MKELISALAKARLEFTEPEQDRTARIESSKANYSYSYASLPEILSSIYPALGNHGLALVTPIEIRDDGNLYAIVTLYHSSGDSISSEYPMPPGLPAKDFGGVLKTVRRHLICSLLNISPTEDDGPSTPTPKGRTQATQPTKVVPTAAKSKAPAQETTSKPLTVVRINQAMKTYNLTAIDIKELLANNMYPEDVYQLSVEQTDNLLDWMQAEAELRLTSAIENGSPTMAEAR